MTSTDDDCDSTIFSEDAETAGDPTLPCMVALLVVVLGAPSGFGVDIVCIVRACVGDGIERKATVAARSNRE